MKKILAILALLALSACQKEEPATSIVPENDQCICVEIYAPVCGDDGVTYSNSCEANCKRVNFTEGVCNTGEAEM